MITFGEVKQICDKLSIENIGMVDHDLSEEISYIVYRIDQYEVDDSVMIDRHIDIEYSFGEYYEVRENSSLFQYIITLCNLPLVSEEREIIIYENNE